MIPELCAAPAGRAEERKQTTTPIPEHLTFRKPQCRRYHQQDPCDAQQLGKRSLLMTPTTKTCKVIEEERTMGKILRRHFSVAQGVRPGGRQQRFHQHPELQPGHAEQRQERMWNLRRYLIQRHLPCLWGPGLLPKGRHRESVRAQRHHEKRARLSQWTSLRIYRHQIPL